MTHELAQLFRRDVTRLAQELKAFPDDASLWRTLPGIANCAGNLALHLEGNLREYIGRQMGNVPYDRDRPREFADKAIPVQELVARVESLQTMIPDILETLTDDQLDAPNAEPRHGSNRRFLLHLHGHFNYHLGQIDYLRRILTAGSAVEFAQL